MDFNFINISAMLYNFTALILIAFLLSVKSERPLSNYFLSLYLFISLFDNSAQFISVYVYHKHPVLGLLISNTVFFIMPMFYLFIKSSIYKDFTITRKTFLHTLSYIVISIIFIPDYIIPLLTNRTNDWVSLIYNSYLSRVVYISIHVQIAVYFIFIFRLLYRYKKLLLENYSSPKFDNYTWLLQLVVVYFFNDLFALTKNIFRFFSSEEVYLYSVNVVALFAISIIFWLIIKALRTPGLFSGVYSDLQLVENMVKKEAVPSIEPKAEYENTQLIERLFEHMKEHEPFLNSSLSMYDLSKQLNVPVRELSIAINHGLNKHFFDFVNEYRINKAKEVFTHSKDDKLTVLEVLYEVGFNSKSSFNTAFKKHSGQTPTEFRKKKIVSQEL